MIERGEHVQFGGNGLDGFCESADYFATLLLVPAGCTKNVFINYFYSLNKEHRPNSESVCFFSFK